MTNGDKIRQMSNEELLKLLYAPCNHCAFEIGTKDCNKKGCKAGIKAYLDMEVEDAR